MIAIGITGAGVSTGPGLVGLPGLAGAVSWPGAPEAGGDVAGATQALQALRRRTGLRYLDPGVERAVRAIEVAGAGADSTEDPAVREARTGILMVTRFGPTATRQQLHESLHKSGGQGVSATLFSNCGYNIAAAVMAKVQSIRGPALTFATTPGWGRRTLGLAGGLFGCGHADCLYLSFTDGDTAIVLRVEPWERIERRRPSRALRLSIGTDAAHGKAGLVVELEGEVALPPGGSWEKMALCARWASSGLDLDPMFLFLAWLWEVRVAASGEWLAAALGHRRLIAYAPEGTPEEGRERVPA